MTIFILIMFMMMVFMMIMIHHDYGQHEKHELIQLPDGHEEYVGIGKSQPILKR